MNKVQSTIMWDDGEVHYLYALQLYFNNTNSDDNKKIIKEFTNVVAGTMHEDHTEKVLTFYTSEHAYYKIWINSLYGYGLIPIYEKSGEEEDE